MVHASRKLERHRHKINIVGFWHWVNFLWAGGVMISIFYLVYVYILPLYGLGFRGLVQYRFVLETILSAVPLIAGSVLVYSKLQSAAPSISVNDEFAFLALQDRYVGVIGLKINTVSGSVLSDAEPPSYNTALLLAIRAGMDKHIDFAYEFGVKSGEPFLRLFISTTGKDVHCIKEILKREATRTEAILLASLENVNVQLLEGNDLSETMGASVGYSISDSGLIRVTNPEKSFLIVEGTPSVTPTDKSSQVGTFISAALRQGYSISLTCVFSKAKPGKENRQLERKWKSIKSKESRNEDSLADQLMKKSLVHQYEETNTNSAWFETTIYVSIENNPEESVKEGVKGLLLSVWGGDDSLVLHEETISKRVLYRVFMKRHLSSQRLHIGRLAAFVNTPVQQLPVISAQEIPDFPIPPSEIIENELEIGRAVYGNRKLGKIGLKKEWLREHVAVLGATGTGKTTLVKKLMAEISSKTSIPWWIFDVKGSEYSDLAAFDDVLVLRPGLDSTFVIEFMENGIDDSNRAHSTFSLLRELIQENNVSELSPAMEKLLRESVLSLARNKKQGIGVIDLVNEITKLAGQDRISQMTRDALLNRLEILTREPLGSILSGGSDAFEISGLLGSRVVFDLRYVSQVGGMDAARLLYNLVAKRIFDASMRRGITSGLHHLVVLEEASNLVPESYTRHSAADVTTGESMVMLQRATGQGVIVVSTRPNISSNILANTASKITFRLPYDSTTGGRFMSIDSEQEQYLRIIQKGRALITMPGSGTFEIATEAFNIIDYRGKTPVHSDFVEPSLSETGTETSDNIKLEESSMIGIVSPDDELNPEPPANIVFDRIGELANHLLAFLTSRDVTVEDDIKEFLTSLDTRISESDAKEAIRDLVSLSTIQREAVPLVSGGFVYSAPGNGLRAVKKVIIDYLSDRLEGICEKHGDIEVGPDLLVNDTGIVIVPEHLKTSSFGSIVERIRHLMSVLRNGVSELVVVVRGSVAAAKLREMLDGSEEFDSVSVVSAFPSSLEKLIERFIMFRKNTEALHLAGTDPETTQVNLIEAVHAVGTATGRALQMKLWFGLIQDFVDLSNGRVKWESILEFIETTSIQSRKGRSAPLQVEEGRRALTELLADEMLTAVRVGAEGRLAELIEGLWIVNTTVLKELKNQTVVELKNELVKRNENVVGGHGYYDICAGKRSYVVFPTQQELSTLIRLHSEIACRNCESIEVVCILTAAEYLEESVVTPSNLIIRTMDEGVASVLT
jgi:hypothetical protein